MSSNMAANTDAILGFAGGAYATRVVNSAMRSALPQFRLPANSSSIQEQAQLFKFTDTTTKHMLRQERRIPIRILEDVIKNPIAVLKDPEGSTNALMYYSRVWRNKKLYNVEVLYDEATNTIMHFQYCTDPIGPLNKAPKL